MLARANSPLGRAVGGGQSVVRSVSVSATRAYTVPSGRAAAAVRG
jgi:hypothetical protein